MGNGPHFPLSPFPSHSHLTHYQLALLLSLSHGDLRLILRVANPSERKNAPSSVKKCPKWGFYYIRASEKMPDTQKWGIFSMFYCIFINKGKCPMSQKMPIFSKKALKMPGWQHCCPRRRHASAIALFFFSSFTQQQRPTPRPPMRGREEGARSGGWRALLIRMGTCDWALL